MDHLIWIGYAITCVASYFLFKHSIRQKRNFTRYDRRWSIAFSCLGPISLIVAMVEILLEGDWSADQIIAQKYQRESNAPYN